mgnify:CR=1 FL=1
MPLNVWQKLKSVKSSNLANLLTLTVVGFICFVVGSKGCPKREYVPVVAPWTRPTIERILRDTLKVPFWNILTKTVKAETLHTIIIMPPPAESLVKIFWGSYDGKTLQLAYYKDSVNTLAPFRNVNIPFTFTSRSQDISVKCSRKFPLKFGLSASILANTDHDVFAEVKGSAKYRFVRLGMGVATDRKIYGCISFEL